MACSSSIEVFEWRPQGCYNAHYSQESIVDSHEACRHSAVCDRSSDYRGSMTAK